MFRVPVDLNDEAVDFMPYKMLLLIPYTVSVN